MITTSFYSPSSIEQVAVENIVTLRPSVSWTGLENISSTEMYARTVEPLYTISGLWMEKFIHHTNELWCTGFNIPAESRTVTGIEFQLYVNRLARIQDAIVQLTLNGELIGENLASLINPVQSDTNTSEISQPYTPVGNYNIYGGTDNLWGTTLTSADLSNPSFGVVIQLSSNRIYPHSDLAQINQVAIRVTYE